MSGRKRRPRRRKTDRMRRGKRPEVYMRRRGCARSLFGLVALAWLVVLTELDWCGCWMQRDYPAATTRRT